MSMALSAGMTRQQHLNSRHASAINHRQQNT
jgi:hypothetical protein